jgi:beta-lactamase regulating signal transducer with metallopeptidase domain
VREAFVEVLVNWLWQGCAVALAATAILRASRRMSATTRYHLWWVTLAVVLALPLFSLPQPAFSFAQDVLRPPSTDDPLTAPGGSWTPASGSLVLPRVPAWMVSLMGFVWFASVMASLSRTCAGLRMLRRTKQTARTFPEAREARLRTWLSVRGRGRRATLGVSDSVRAAAVLGFTSPAIVVAPGALGVLKDGELDQIVVHEWAHVQRRDDLARLGQRVIVALAGLHPAVWWIDRQIDVERETACDDWAVNATGSARGLAVSLTKLASLPDGPSDSALLPAALLSSELTRRVVRLLDPRRNTSTGRGLGWYMLVAPALGALALAVASVELVVTSPMMRSAPRDASSAAAVAGRTGASDPVAAAPARPASVPAGSPRSGPAPGGHAKTFAGVAPQAVLPVDSVARRGTAAGVSDLSAIGPANPRDQAHVTAPVFEEPLGLADLPGAHAPVAADSLPVTTAEGASAGPPPAGNPTIWGATADAGVTFARGSKKAAVSTAGFFTRFSRSFTRVF